MQAPRIARVTDLRGCFKLKGLDYVFNRLPILAMRIALPGMPLEDGRNVGLFDSHSALADGVVALIDNFQSLNARQEGAYAACADCFDWQRVGRRLVAHMREPAGRPVRAGTAAPTSDAVSQPARLAAGR
jgi:glycosyltransferase involved in cell wall biosynthesis